MSFDVAGTLSFFTRKYFYVIHFVAIVCSSRKTFIEMARSKCGLHAPSSTYFQPRQIKTFDALKYIFHLPYLL